MSKIKQITERPKNFVARHKIALTAATSVVATATLMSKFQGDSYREAVKFIEDAGLLEQFIESHPIIVK